MTPLILCWHKKWTSLRTFGSRAFGDSVVRAVFRDFLKTKGFICKMSSCVCRLPPVELRVSLTRSRFADRTGPSDRHFGDRSSIL